MIISATRNLCSILPILGGTQVLTAMKTDSVLLAVVTALCGILTVVMGIFITHYLNHISKIPNTDCITRELCNEKHKASMDKIDAKYDLLNQKLDLFLERLNMKTQINEGIR